MGAMAAKQPDAKLSDHVKQKLHRIAREAIKSALDGREFLVEPDEELDYKRGAFVTLKIDGDLRGCIGQVRARDPLHKVIADMAVAAAFDDPRFPSLSQDEYERLEYEISVLTPLERVKDFSEIEIGRDGLMIRLDLHSGLLLPQVASEYGWTVKGS
jgi:AmmeMemoRadiSam system protein A